MKQQTKLHFGLCFHHAAGQKVCWASHMWENGYYFVYRGVIKEQGDQFHFLANPACPSVKIAKVLYNIFKHRLSSEVRGIICMIL